MSMTEQTPTPEASTLKLWIEDDAGGKASYPLIHQELSIGRDEANEICLTQRDISRRHAQMTLQSDQLSLLVRDLESFTGIKLNGKRVAGQCTFRQGDYIEIGGYILSLEGPESASTAESAPAPVEPLPPEAHARLIAVSSNLAGQEYPLQQRELIIGREPSENDMVIHHRSVSRSHAKIVWRDGVFSVIDLRSSNGIFVNGSAFRAAKLVTGDIITLGHVKLRFVAPGDPYVFNPADVEHVAIDQSSQLKPILIMIVAVAVAWFASRQLAMQSTGPSSSPLPPASSSGVQTPTERDTQEPQGDDRTGARKSTTGPASPVAGDEELSAEEREEGAQGSATEAPSDTEDKTDEGEGTATQDDPDGGQQEAEAEGEGEAGAEGEAEDDAEGDGEATADDGQSEQP